MRDRGFMHGGGLPQRSRRRQREAGFAMMLVFLMAAVAVLMLYKEVPRLAFDAQRTRERLLIAHGEEYKRAIQMFVVKNKRWPSKVEELESLNNQRYLRKRFVDPMTGKDEWRMIHIANGVLTDSVVTKPPANPNDQKDTSGFQWGTSTAGGDLNTGQGQQPGSVGLVGANVANRKRSSDNMAPGLGNPTDGQTTDPNNPQQNQGVPGTPGFSGIPQQPGMVNGQLVPGAALPGVPGIPGQMPTQGTAGQQFPGQVGQDPSQVGQPGQYPMPIQPMPGQLPGQPVNSQVGGVSPYQTTAGANGLPPGVPQPGNPVNGQAGANQAQQMIQQLLTSPRPGGMPGVPGQGGTVGSGIAGVASNADALAIMSYNDHTNYKEWEFIFDPNKMKVVPNPLGGGAGTPASAMGSIGGSQIGSPIGNSTDPGNGGSTVTGGGGGYGGYGGGGYGGYGSSGGTTTVPPANTPPPTGPTRFVTDVGQVPVAPPKQN